MEEGGTVVNTLDRSINKKKSDTHTTGDGIGELLADEGDFSLSSGSSTELILIGLALNIRLLCTGLEGAGSS